MFLVLVKNTIAPPQRRLSWPSNQEFEWSDIVEARKEKKKKVL
jgi:hypothetical protein